MSVKQAFEPCVGEVNANAETDMQSKSHREGENEELC